MKLDKDTKDEIRYIVQQEIGKAFKAALSAALNTPLNLGEALDRVKNDERKKRNEVIKPIGAVIKIALGELEDEANAKIVEKTEPERAERIRKIKGMF